MDVSWRVLLGCVCLDALPSDGPAVDLKSATVNNRELLFFLISRRSRYRAGTRYFTRGIDANGNTANNNESEQIVLFDPLPANGQNISRGRVDGKEKLSFVQTRGSVPVFWAEINNLRYKPDMQIMDIPETVSFEFLADLNSKAYQISKRQ
jgi:hypothetical protein